MRAPFQILAIPYRIENGEYTFCVFHRSDFDQWQFVSGGGEDAETPMQAAKREIFEECEVRTENILQLTSLCYIPTNIFPKRHLNNWPLDMYVVPEYSFGFLCEDEITLSHEHTSCEWLTYEQAKEKLHWDSNRTALYELYCRLQNQRIVF